ncbi:MAG: hypothetical protein ACJ79K_09355 [Gemmatimonadaceae bacterium]
MKEPDAGNDFPDDSFADPSRSPLDFRKLRHPLTKTGIAPRN